MIFVWQSSATSIEVALLTIFGCGKVPILRRRQHWLYELCLLLDLFGEDPEHVRQVLAGTSGSDSVGLGNVDGRLRSAFGDEYGLVVETAPGAGTKVTLRVPKFAAGVHA